MRPQKLSVMRALALVAGLAPVVPGAMAAQTTGTITGQVMGQLGERGVIGAQVVVVGTELGAVTGPEGRYQITGVPAGPQRVQASHVGHRPQTRMVRVAAGEVAEAFFQLEPTAVVLEGIVAVGYGTQQRRDVTGAISSVNLDQVETAPIVSVDQALQGQAAGVQVTQANGAPGGAVSVRIRGSTSITAGNGPLYVIDGVPAFTEPNTSRAGRFLNPLAALSPGDIESIQVLKDASATAIYGSRGANGVVLITTKRGVRGRAQVELEASYGMQAVPRTLPLLDARQFAEFINEARANTNQQPMFSADEIARMGTGTDWQEEIFEPAPLQRYGISISGGDERTRYMLSGSLYDQEGVIVESGFRRYSGRVNLDREVTDRFRVGSSLSGSRFWSDLANTDGGLTNAVVISALQFSPVEPVKDAEGNYTLVNPLVVDNPNPVATSLELTDRRSIAQLIGNIFAEYDITDALRFRSSVGGTYGSNRYEFFAPSFILEGAGGGDARMQYTESRDLVSDNILTYAGALGEGQDLDVTAGFSYQEFRSDLLSARAQEFPTDATGAKDLSAGARISPPQTGVNEWTLASWLARANYSLNNKYLLTLTGRYDGSSKFGANSKWGFFPSAAVAWRLSEEPFLRGADVVSDAKLRLSYGETGNQEIGTYASLPAMTTTRYNLDGQQVVGYVPTSRAPNPDLRWESARQLNAGLDLGLWDNRLALTLEAYTSTTDDLLLEVALPATTGFATQLRNVGSIRNTGVELELNTINVERDRFRWTSTLTLGSNRNKVLDLGPGQERLYLHGTGDYSFGPLRVGHPLGIFEGYRTDGIWQLGDDVASSGDPIAAPGEWKFVDVDGDGRITPDDRTILGHAQPDLFGGLTNHLSFGPFDLDVFLSGVYGNEILNATFALLKSGSATTNEFTDALDRWTPENASQTVPRANAHRTRKILDSHIEDGSFLRLQSVNLGYTLPDRWVGGVSTARLNVSAHNLWTLTGYSGYDPEVSSFASDPTRAGVDRGTYPRARTVNVGIQVTF